MRYTRLIVLWLIVSLALIRVMGVHVHAHGHVPGQSAASAVDVHTFDAGIHREHHGGDAASGVSVSAGDHLEAHVEHGDRDVDSPDEVGKWPKFGWNLALLAVALALLWLPPPPLLRSFVAPLARASRRPAYFTPPSQAPPLSA